MAKSNLAKSVYFTMGLSGRRNHAGYIHRKAHNYHWCRENLKLIMNFFSHFLLFDTQSSLTVCQSLTGVEGMVV